MVAPKMVNFAPIKRNATSVSGTPFPSVQSFFLFPLPPESVPPYADVITKFSGIDRFPFSLSYGAPLRALRFFDLQVATAVVHSLEQFKGTK